eukprot:gene12336-6009_t
MKLFFCLTLVLLVQFIIASPSTSGDQAEMCMPNNPKLPKISGNSPFSETVLSVGHCKACHQEGCKNIHFSLHKTPEEVEKYRSICKDKETCFCSDVALTLMTDEKTLEEGNALIEGLRHASIDGKPPRNMGKKGSISCDGDKQSNSHHKG